MRGLNPKILFSSREEQQDVLSKFGEILVCFGTHLQVMFLTLVSAPQAGVPCPHLALPQLCEGAGGLRAPAPARWVLGLALSEVWPFPDPQGPAPPHSPALGVIGGRAGTHQVSLSPGLILDPPGAVGP